MNPSLPVSTCVHVHVHVQESQERKKNNPQNLSMKYQHPASWRVLKHTGKITGTEIRLHGDARRMFGLFTISARTYLHVHAHVQRGKTVFSCSGVRSLSGEELFSALHPWKLEVRKEMNSFISARHPVGDTSWRFMVFSPRVRKNILCYGVMSSMEQELRKMVITTKEDKGGLFISLTGGWGKGSAYRPETSQHIVAGGFCYRGADQVVAPPAHPHRATGFSLAFTFCYHLVISHQMFPTSGCRHVQRLSDFNKHGGTCWNYTNT